MPFTRNIFVNRNSVCAGDDIDSHGFMLTIPEEATLGSCLQDILNRGYLPKISGGKATWVADFDQPVAVVAQEWDKPRFVVPEDTSISSWTGPIAIHFRYWAQSDPQLVFDCLISRKPLPSPMGK